MKMNQLGRDAGWVCIVCADKYMHGLHMSKGLHVLKATDF